MHPNGLPDHRAERGAWWKLAALVVALVAGLVLLEVLGGPGDRLDWLRDLIDGLGPWGPVVFVVVYAVAVLFPLPGSALTIAAGALFGSVLGVVLVSIGGTLGACVSFLIARYLARDAMVQWLSGNALFRRLDQLTAEHGAVIVALARLVPVFPFTLINYGFGLTRVPFWTYLFWSALCLLPGTVLYVVSGAAATTALSERRIPWELVGAAAGTGLILLLLFWYARHRLRAKETKAKRPRRGGQEAPTVE
jgi:uncharacterized membrane protein YdjX (TVP38/TMEM64 family)